MSTIQPKLSEPKTFAEMRAAHLARQARLSPTAPVMPPAPALHEIIGLCPNKTLLHLTLDEHRIILRMRRNTKHKDSVPVVSQDHINRIVQAVSDLYGISNTPLFSNRMTRSVFRPRRVACYLCRKLTTLSLEEIGIVLGRDLTTVFHGFKKIDDRRKHDRELDDELTWLEGQLAIGRPA